MNGSWDFNRMYEEVNNLGVGLSLIPFKDGFTICRGEDCIYVSDNSKEIKGFINGCKLGKRYGNN